MSLLLVLWSPHALHTLPCNEIFHSSIPNSFFKSATLTSKATSLPLALALNINRATPCKWSRRKSKSKPANKAKVFYRFFLSYGHLVFFTHFHVTKFFKLIELLSPMHKAPAFAPTTHCLSRGHFLWPQGLTYSITSIFEVITELFTKSPMI